MKKVLFFLFSVVLLGCNYSGHYNGKADLAIYEEPVAAADYTTEEYKYIQENDFKNASDNPLSTFSIDVDNASYSNVRRFIFQNQLPPKDAIRLEEMINYFKYDYPKPEGGEPFSVFAEAGPCPWNENTRLVQIGISGKDIDLDNAPSNNLTFLIDVSGSMAQELSLVKASLKLLVNKMRSQDKIALVVYAGSAGLVLEPTTGNRKDEIISAIDQLESGGSTAGGEGIFLAYKTAKDNFIDMGNNRVILATDGDFNVGVSSEGDLVRIVEEKRKEGIYLTVLGFGQGNYKDSKMEAIADKGNGNYYYIDNLMEAKKVFIHQLGGTLFAIAKDVKLQVEFNPSYVKEYRLIGYENRLLNNEDFNDDSKDAGELGAGHTVTAIYEVVPAENKRTMDSKLQTSLRYQESQLKSGSTSSGEWLFVKINYKKPDEDKSRQFSFPLSNVHTSLKDCSENFRFASSVVAYGQCLRGSRFKGLINYPEIKELAEASLGKDEEGYRHEFVRMVEMTEMIEN